MLKVDMTDLDCFSSYVTDYDAVKITGRGIAHIRRLAQLDKLPSIQIAFGVTTVLLLQREAVEAYAETVKLGRPSCQPLKQAPPPWWR